MASTLITPPGSHHGQLGLVLPPPPKPKSATSSAKRRAARRLLSRMALGIGPAIPLSMLFSDGGEDGEGGGGSGGSSSSIVECINLHSNELRTLAVVDDRPKDEGGCGSSGGAGRGDGTGTRSFRKAGRGSKSSIAGNAQHPPAPSNQPNDSTLSATTMFSSLLELDVSSNSLGLARRFQGRSSSDCGAGAGGHAGTSLLQLAPNLRVLNLSANGLDCSSLSLVLGLQRQEEEEEHGKIIILPNLSTLDLSHNALSEVPADLGTASCPNLQSINLVGNRISSLPNLLEALYPLRGSLASLYLRDNTTQSSDDDDSNPVCKSKGYRERMICALEALGNLDGQMIADDDRSEARRLVDLGLCVSHTDQSSRNLQRTCNGRDKKQSRHAMTDTATSRRRKDEAVTRTAPSGNDSTSDSTDDDASDEAMRKLVKLENRVKLLTSMAATQAEATERLLQSNGPAGCISATSSESPLVRSTVSSELRKRVRGRGNHTNHVTRVTEVAVQTKSSSWSRRDTSTTSNGGVTIKSAAAQQMALILRRGQSRELMSAFTSLKLHAIMSRYAEEANSAKGSVSLITNMQMDDERNAFQQREVSLQSTIRELRQAVEDHRHGIMVAEDQLQEAEDDKATLVSRHKQEVEDLREDFETEMEDTKELCYEDSQDQMNRIAGLEEDLAEATKTADDYHRQLAATLAELERTRNKLSDAEERCNTLVEEHSQAIETAKDEAMEACNIELRAAQKESQTKLRQVREALEKATHRAASDRATLDEAKGTIEWLNVDVTSLKDELSTKDNAIRNARSELEMANADKERVELMLKSKSDQCEQLNDALRAKARECDGLEDGTKHLRRALADRDVELDTISKKATELQKELIEVEMAARDAIDSAQQRVMKAKARLSKAKRESEKLRQEIYTLEQKLMEVDRLEALVNDREDSMKKCEQELLAVKDAYDTKEARLVSRHEAELENARASCRNEIESLQEEIEHAKKSKGKTVRKMQLAEDDARELSSVLQQERIARQSAEERITKLEAALRQQQKKAKSAIEDLCKELVPKTPTTK